MVTDEMVEKAMDAAIKTGWHRPLRKDRQTTAVAVKALQELHAAEHAKLGEMLLDKSEDGQSKANWQGGRVNGIAAALAALSAQVQDVAGLLDETWNAAVEQAAAIANDCVHLTPDPGAAIRTMWNGRTKLHTAAPAKQEG